MKKIITFLVILTLLALPLISSAQERKTFLIGVSQPNDTHPLRRAQYDAIRDYEATHPGVKFIVTSARLDSGKQANDIEDLISMGCDLILVCPHQSAALSPSIRRIHEAGIPIMSFDRILAPDVQDLAVSHIGPDYHNQGTLAAETIAKILNGKGNILIIEGVPGSSSNIERFEAFDKVMANYPDIKVLAKQVGNYQREQAIPVVENLLQAHTDVDLIFSENDEMGLGALQVVQASGRKILLGSCDGQKQSIKAILDGVYTFTITQPIMFPETADVAVDYLNGKSVPKLVPLSSKVIDASNAAESYNPEAIF